MHDPPRRRRGGARIPLAPREGPSPRRRSVRRGRVINPRRERTFGAPPNEPPSSRSREEGVGGGGLRGDYSSCRHGLRPALDVPRRLAMPDEVEAHRGGLYPQSRETDSPRFPGFRVRVRSDRPVVTASVHLVERSAPLAERSAPLAGRRAFGVTSSPPGQNFSATSGMGSASLY